MKAMTTGKEPILCKLEIVGKMVEKGMDFNYLGVNITSSEQSRKIILKPKLKNSKSGWLPEWSCLEKEIYEKGNKIKNI